ncbi:hypothetical protein FACS1894142_7560 [Spirochaetia bacterium]|nr:hypothetical protein FACS1894142_7560 [Spirochaetia bacterium]
MKRLLLLLLFPFIFAATCESVPEPLVSVGMVERAAEQVLPEPVPSESTVASAPEVFDPGAISQEVFDATKAEVQHLVEELNGIIRSRKYDAWVSYLDSGYLEYLGSPEGLKELNESPRLKSQNISLKNARDYFTHVVVPSRANDRIDDIEFVSPTRVKAFTINTRGQRLRLYELEKTLNGWKILNS